MLGYKQSLSATDHSWSCCCSCNLWALNLFVVINECNGKGHEALTNGCLCSLCVEVLYRRSKDRRRIRRERLG
jgi:hypothetical protein